MARRHVLIGSGPGAIAAAETIRDRDPAADIVVVGAEPAGYYSRPGLAYYLAREEPEERLFPLGKRDLEVLGVRRVTDRVVGVEPASRRVTLASGGSLDYDRLLFATGSLAIPLRTPGAELSGVVKLDDLDDARDLIARSRGAKSAVVVGGGITALEIVEGLRARKVHVHYFMRKDRYWSNVLSETESRIVEEGLTRRGVEIHYFTELDAIVGDLGRVTGVRTRAGEMVACDMVAVAIGVLPRAEIARAAGLECERGILVDQFLRSSSGDIYAAGDVAEVCDPVTGARDLDILWNSAVAEGRIAGANMAGDPVNEYRKAISLNVTRLAGFKITIIGTVGNGEDSDLEGIARGDSDSWRQLGEATSVECETGGSHIRLALTSDAIVGAVVMGEQALSFPLQDLMEQRADVGSIVPELRAPDAPVADIIERYWRQWREGRV